MSEIINFIKVNKKISFLLFLLFLISLSLNTSNLKQGLPSEKMINLI